MSVVWNSLKVQSEKQMQVLRARGFALPHCALDIIGRSKALHRFRSLGSPSVVGTKRKLAVVQTQSDLNGARRMGIQQLHLLTACRIALPGLTVHRQHIADLERSTDDFTTLNLVEDDRFD